MLDRNQLKWLAWYGMVQSHLIQKGHFRDDLPSQCPAYFKTGHVVRTQCHTTSLRSCSPDGAATDCGNNIKLQLTTHLSTPKG